MGFVPLQVGERMQNSWQVHLVVFPATAFMLQNAWRQTGPTSRIKKRVEKTKKHTAAEDVNVSGSVKNVSFCGAP